MFESEEKEVTEQSFLIHDTDLHSNEDGVKRSPISLTFRIGVKFQLVLFFCIVRISG